MAAWWRHGGVVVASWWRRGGIMVASWWRWYMHLSPSSMLVELDRHRDAKLRNFDNDLSFHIAKDPGKQIRTIR